MGKKLKRLIFSDILVDSTPTKRVAYIGIMAALCIVENTFFEFPIGVAQFSLSIFISMLTGYIIGPIFGATAAFTGDLVAFIYSPKPMNTYTPWVGVSLAVAAVIAGLVLSNVNIERKLDLYVKLAIASIATFCVCTVCITTTALWLLWYNYMTYPEFIIFRFFANGQIYNSLFNYAVLFITFPTFMSLKKRLTKK